MTNFQFPYEYPYGAEGGAAVGTISSQIGGALGIIWSVGPSIPKTTKSGEAGEALHIEHGMFSDVLRSKYDEEAEAVEVSASEDNGNYEGGRW